MCIRDRAMEAYVRMLTFVYYELMVHQEYTPPCQIINVECYVEILHMLRDGG